jgi:hypothetical protein
MDVNTFNKNGASVQPALPPLLLCWTSKFILLVSPPLVPVYRMWAGCGPRSEKKKGTMVGYPTKSTQNRMGLVVLTM